MRESGLRSTFLALTLSMIACTDPASPSSAGGGGGGGGGIGGSIDDIAGASAGSGGLAPHAAGRGGDETHVPCTPNLGPDDEFFVPCEDAAVRDDASTPPSELDAGATEPDAGEPVDAAVSADASVLPVSDAGDSPTQGACDRSPDTCATGFVTTVLANASCTLFGNTLSINRTVCDACGTTSTVLAYGAVIMPCGVCYQDFRSSTNANNEPFPGGACRDHSADYDLTGTAVDPECIDVYAAVSSGEVSGSGAMTVVDEEVRICRCDRLSGTCTTCAYDHCGDEP